MTIDYAVVRIPEKKNPKKYSFKERRAEILKLIYQAGHPYKVAQQTLADRYSVTQSQIAHDMRELREYVKGNYGKNIHLVTDIVYNRAVAELMSEGNWKQAAEVQKMQIDWLFNTGKLDKTPDKLQVETGTSYEDVKAKYDEIIKEQKRLASKRSKE